ncbi:MAG: ATP-binding cassette domain-containing protein, partial [Mesorhizobium sp.]
MTISQTIFMEGVSKRYGDSYVVRDVDLSIAPGECVAIVGHNGAGKSTLVKMALGLITPTAGLHDGYAVGLLDVAERV